MRSVLRACGLAIFLSAMASAATPPIKPAELLNHIKFLASDDLKGRGDGSPELERAAEYIAQQFKAAGLRPGGSDHEWFQPFELQSGLDIGPRNALVISSGSRSIPLVLGMSYYPMAAPANDMPGEPSTRLDAVPLVFAGYGLTAPSLDYDDYARVDVSGKAVLILSHEPQEGDRNSRFNGNLPIPESSLLAKATAARNHGARLLIVISDPKHQIDDANYNMFAVAPDADDLGIPVLRARRDRLFPLVLAWGLDRLAAEIDNDLQPRSRPLAGATVNYTEFLSKQRRTVRNVVGILPGSDPTLAAQAVVIGAHYDHVGLGGRYSNSPEKTGEIHNGADDNASGTASIIEIAKAAAADRSRFPRSLVFVAFAGEERGLLGSAYYANNPAIPDADTLAMLNLDMVGRSHGAVDVSGLEVSPSLLGDFNTAARVVGGLEIRHEGPGAGRSDDANFLDRRIPAINFFTGFHRDYHRPTDDWPLIDAEGTARVASLALEFAARIAERQGKPEFVTPPRR
jgi:hypothetical protein